MKNAIQDASIGRAADLQLKVSVAPFDRDDSLVATVLVAGETA